METQGLVGFRLRKRGAGVEQSAKAAKQAVPVPAPAPAAKKRRVSTQPSVKQALLRAAAVPRAAEAGGSDGIAALPLRREAGETAARADAAHAGAGGLDLALELRQLPGWSKALEHGAAGPDTQPQVAEAELRAAPCGVHAPARAAPLAAGHAALDAAPELHFEQEALDSSDEDECDDDEDGAEPSALSELESRVSALKRAMDSCERVRLACVPGSAKAQAAARQRDALVLEIAVLARFLSPEGMSDDEEEAEAPAATAAAADAARQ